ncbi:MAG: tRNA-dihydrouridine synthase family protein [Bacteroidales bacterium]|nr:tRNA-dihydrouridine synthase family protein [Bacteroidales bacterium]
MAEVWLAPLHGITLYTFRNCLFRHTRGIKTAITPFFPVQEAAKLNVRKHADFRLENNPSDVEIIPQLIGNVPAHFVDTMNALNGEFGYTRFNWNIGCPMNQIVRKKRGCGIMPYSQMVADVVGTVVAQTPFHFSVKMRLGMYSSDESVAILKILNDYPLDFVVIHPRLGVQQYEGTTDLEALARCLSVTRHKVVYSGDIQTVSDYDLLKKRFPEIGGWMLGRGILCDPFLAEKIEDYDNNVEPKHDLEERYSRFTAFYDDLLDTMLGAYNERRVLANLKELWHYFARYFSLSQEELQKLLRIEDFSEFVSKTGLICRNLS